MLATDVELRPWCPVHVAPLVGEPRLCRDGDSGWFVILASMSCPGAAQQSDCIQLWIIHLEPEEISPEQARARTKIGS